MSEIFGELGRVPGWAWWLLLNFASVTWFALMQVPELEHPRRGLTLAVRAMCMVVLACVGVFFLVGVAVAEWMHAHLEQAGAP